MILLLVFSTLIVSGCDASSSPPGNTPPALEVAVSILPQADFLRRIGGPHVRTIVLVGPGQSPATFDPTLKQMARLARARLYFRIGVAFEQRLVPKIRRTYPGLRIIDTRRGIALRPMDQVGGNQRSAHQHDHLGTPDPHVWLNPRLVAIQARTICDALKTADPVNADDYERNCRVFQADLRAVDARIADLLAPLRGRAFFVFHPAFGYFADAYGLRQVAIETGGKRPTARQLAALIARARRERVRLIFVQKQFAASSAKAVADAIGGAVVQVDPLAGDYLDNLWHIANEIAKALNRRDTRGTTVSSRSPAQHGATASLEGD